MFSLSYQEIKISSEIIILALLYFLEWSHPFFEQLFKSQKDRIRHITKNLGLGLFNALIVSFVFSYATYLISSKSHTYLNQITCFILFDLWMYLWHRANHIIPFLWHFHRLHHSDTKMDFSTALRFHPIEIIISSFLRLGVIALLGIQMQTLIIYEICLQVVILFHHSNVNLPEKYDRILRLFIVSPNMHRVHHSNITSETNSNYSSIFSFWDRLFKSFKQRKDPQNITYGI